MPGGANGKFLFHVPILTGLRRNLGLCRENRQDQVVKW